MAQAPLPFLDSPLAGPPTLSAQEAFLGHVRALLGPLIVANKLPQDFVLRPGPRLRRRYGQCRRFHDGRAPEVMVRCTQDGTAHAWRTSAAIVGTLLHELAHLRHAHHRPRFWALCRRLLDQAAVAGVYDPEADDSAERAQGDAKLAGSAAHGLAQRARLASHARRLTNREAMAAWKVGDVVFVTTRRSPIAGLPLEVIRKLRTRLEVRAPDGRRYLVPASLLLPRDA